MKKLEKLLMGLCMVLFLCLIPTMSLQAKPLDEILNYDITVTPCEDASVDLLYHIDWKVLDSDSEGPLEWVQIGIPNNHVLELEGRSGNISSITQDGTKVKIYFKKKYYSDEVVDFDFYIKLDYLYQVDKFVEGYTVYSFTPGWFDGIDVDNLNIRWNMDKADSFTPECIMEDDYYTWSTHLDSGEKYTVTVTYPNDALGFDLSYVENEEEESAIENFFIGFFALVFLLVLLALFALPFVAIYAILRGFSSTTKKTTRTKIEYYGTCPSCGGTRKEGTDECAYCGRNMIKHKEEITEEKLKDEEKDALSFTKDGDYHYGSSPNVFIRVNNVKVKTPKSSLGSSIGSSGIFSSSGSRSYSSHSSSSHSSSHHSCACACACACAGGGRAGCSTKDFYNTNLREEQIRKAVGEKI